MKSYAGKVLRVNLTDKSVNVEPLNMQYANDYIGGRGLGTRMYFDEVEPTIDPLSPENKLIIATGPMTGAPVPTGGRYMVITKSPLTGAIASSNSGGHWGPEFKSCGYDAIVIEGKADSPCYIDIKDDKVEIKDADHLWGKLVIEAENTLKQTEGEKCRVLLIGPAGEKLSKMASIMNDHDRAAGRSGVGAVMGSKNLKAITVKGSNKLELHDDEKLKEVVKKCNALIKENGVTGEGLPTYGTAVLVNIINEGGINPTNNFQTSQFADAEGISGETMAEKFLVKRSACARCPIGCGRVVKLDDQVIGGPEYETLWSFGSDCGVSDMNTVIKANHLCNEYGMDTISVGATIAAAMELKQKGYIKDEELNGVALEFGNNESVVAWTEMIGKAEGLGAKMAMGSYELCDSYGMAELSMSVKKQELPAYDPRAIQGQAVQYATSNRGGCHVRGYLISPEILGLPEKLDRFSIDKKPEWAKIFQDLTAVIDSMGMCLFTSFALGANEYSELYNASAGTQYDADKLMIAGERIYNIERVFNIRAGVGGDQDTLPKRLLEEPIVDGPSKGEVARLSEMLPKYYEVRGWVSGEPTPEKLRELGIDI